jgi:hypothetical protein
MPAVGRRDHDRLDLRSPPVPQQSCEADDLRAVLDDEQIALGRERRPDLAVGIQGAVHLDELVMEPPARVGIASFEGTHVHGTTL